MWENITTMSSTPTEQMGPTPNAITIDMAKVQLSNIFCDFFSLQHNRIRGTNNVNRCCDECRKGRGAKIFVTRSVAHNYTRRPIHDSII